jgi:hypothetical protein
MIGLTGDDCPAFEGVFEFCSISAGGSIGKLYKSMRSSAEVPHQVPLRSSTQVPRTSVSIGREDYITPRRPKQVVSATSMICKSNCRVNPLSYVMLIGTVYWE